MKAHSSRQLQTSFRASLPASHITSKMNFIILLVAIFGFSHVSAHLCQCTGFFTSDVNENHRVYNILDAQAPSCSVANECREQCLNTIAGLTNKGDMSYEYEGIPIKEHICRNYKNDIQNGEVGAYSRLCNGQWELLQTAPERICCKDGSSVPC